MSITRTNPSSVAPPTGPYTHLAVVPANCDLLVLAGQVGVDAQGTLPQDIEAQLRNALANATAILSSEGAGPKDILKVNLWLVQPVERERFLTIWADFHGGEPPPPATFAYVTGLVRPEYLVEVEVWAARPASSVHTR